MKIALIADIHSNMEAFEAVLKHIDNQRIKNIICIGDIVGYGANPNECCDIIKQRKIPTCMGNHDINAVTLKEITRFNDYAQAALQWTNKQLTEANKKFLQKLPKILNIKLANKTILAVHGSLNDPLFEYIYPTTSDTVIKDLLTRSKSNILIMGHTHMPFIKRYEFKLVLNPGSVGQPRDNIPEASYISFDLETSTAVINRIKYNTNKTSSKILTAKLPNFLAERLFRGI